MKTIFDEATRSELLQRFRNVAPDRHPQWGRLTAPKMLAHVGDQLRMALGEIPPSQPKGFLSTRLGSWLAIYVMPWPHGFKGPREAFTTVPATWDRDLDELAALLRRVGEGDVKAAWPKHPLFGKLTGKDWGALSYKHLDHHLRQFSA